MNDKIYYIKENILNNNINHKIVYDFMINIIDRKSVV